MPAEVVTEESEQSSTGQEVTGQTNEDATAPVSGDSTAEATQAFVVEES